MIKIDLISNQPVNKLVNTVNGPVKVVDYVKQYAKQLKKHGRHAETIQSGDFITLITDRVATTYSEGVKSL
jgi:hypothetical protein